MQWNPYRLKRGIGGGAPPKLAAVLEDEELACGYCKGTGKQLHMNSSCPVCRGKGFNKVKSPAVVCAYCKGTGFAENRTASQTTCPACAGKTALSVKEPFELCDACEGTGRAHPMRVPCFTCKGAGVKRVKPPSAVKGPSKYPVNEPGRPQGPPPELFPEPEEEEEGIEKRAPVKVLSDPWGPEPNGLNNRA